MAINEGFLAELSYEAKNTRKMLERLPQDKFEFRPHDKSYTLLYLAQHIAHLPVWTGLIMHKDQMDLMHDLHRPEPVASTEALLQFFDTQLNDAVQALAGISDDQMNEPWQLNRGGVAMFTLPRKIVFRNMVLNHIIHHRGQLSVYLRLLNIPVPGMYGPSADEK